MLIKKAQTNKNHKANYLWYVPPKVFKSQNESCNYSHNLYIPCPFVMIELLNNKSHGLSPPAQCSRPTPELFFWIQLLLLKSSDIVLKSNLEVEFFVFFYFEHCVLTISKLHLPTCRTEIGEFHSIKCLF